LSAGDHLIIGSDCYRRTRQFCQEHLKRLGIEVTVVPTGDYTGLGQAVQSNTKLLFSESPTNPYLRVINLEFFAQIAKQHGVILAIDSTFATPINQCPLDFGADLVLHSATKYLGGHNNLLAGVVTGSAELVKRVKLFRDVFGGIPDAGTASKLERGLKTLRLRVEQQNRSALSIANFLAQHPKIERVWYPGLESHPDHSTAQTQMSGFGGVISFEVAGDLTTTATLVDLVELPRIAPSFGGVDTLIEQPALISFYELTTEERLRVGIRDNLIRYSVGIEPVQALINDLENALSQIPQAQAARLAKG
jgi:cystathionine gamma-synthase